MRGRNAVFFGREKEVEEEGADKEARGALTSARRGQGLARAWPLCGHHVGPPGMLPVPHCFIS